METVQNNILLNNYLKILQLGDLYDHLSLRHKVFLLKQKWMVLMTNKIKRNFFASHETNG